MAGSAVEWPLSEIDTVTPWRLLRCTVWPLCLGCLIAALVVRASAQAIVIAGHAPPVVYAPLPLVVTAYYAPPPVVPAF